ncbi:MAG: PKD-like family lipoprotein [Odoribacter splanchnicus]
MKKIFYISVLLLSLISCFDDEGNYDYNQINEWIINGFGNRDTTLNMLYMLDTLRINAELECTLDKTVLDEDYTWRWELENKQGLKKEVIARTRQLVLPMDMTPGNYELHLRVKDNKTGIVQSVSEPLNVAQTYSKGLLILGDRENGDVQLDMVAMVEAKDDTIILKDMLKDTELPTMKHGIEVFHTGENNRPGFFRVWIMSETGAYYLNSATMTGDASNNFSSMFYTSLDVPEDAFPVECYPRLSIGGQSGTSNGYVRGFRLNDGSLVFTNNILTELYGNPVNHLYNDTKLLKLFPGVLYAVRYMKGIMVYDVENNRFLGLNTPGSDLNLTVLNDMPGDAFPFDQNKLGRTMVHMENTRNPINADRGRSYALLKNKNGNYFIYCFYLKDNRVTNGRGLKIGYWHVRADIIKDIDKAEKFLFSSTRPVFYYLVGSKVYSYCFNINNESCEVVADFGSDEVTWWDVDLWTELDFDRIWVATYNPQTGGTLTKFREPEDQNGFKWVKTSTSWSGFPKIKSVAWRNCAN